MVGGETPFEAKFARSAGAIEGEGAVPSSARPDEERSLFRRATDYDALWASWERVRANAGAAGGDGVSVRQFDRQAETHVARLSHRLRTGRYEPGPTRRVLVPKKSGGLRPLDIPCVADRVAQGAVAMALQPILDPTFEDASFAYRPGRSVADAVSRVAQHRRAGFEWVVDADVTRYFERIPHEALLGRLDLAVDDPLLVDLIGLWLEATMPSGLGVPQGSPLSPLLANFYFDAIDEGLEGRGLRLVRYADDFLILARSKEQAEAALVKSRDLLAAHGLELNAEKTRVVSFDQGLRFLGHVFLRSTVWKDVTVEDAPPEDVVSAAERQIALGLPPNEDPDEDDEDGSLAEDPRHGPRGRWSPRRRVAHLLEPGRVLTAKGELFRIDDTNGAEVLRLNHVRVDRIEVGPEIAIDVAALDLAAASDTEIVRVDGHGRTLGRWSGPEPARAARHLAQARTIFDEDRRRGLAHAFLLGRVFNQRTLLKRLARNRDDAELDKVSVELQRTVRWMRAGRGTIEEAMGREGRAASLYWPALAQLLDRPWAFSGRCRRRVGEDPFNLVLDVTASLLAREARMSLLRHALHPGFGVLHAADDEEDALVHDFVEEFRAPLAEAVSFTLFAREALSEVHFVDRGDGSLRLSRTGWAAIVRGFEIQLARPIRDPTTGTTMLWRGLLDLQAARLAAHFETGAVYRPYLMDW